MSQTVGSEPIRPTSDPPVVSAGSPHISALDPDAGTRPSNTVSGLPTNSGSNNPSQSQAVNNQAVDSTDPSLSKDSSALIGWNNNDPSQTQGGNAPATKSPLGEVPPVPIPQIGRETLATFLDGAVAIGSKTIYQGDAPTTQDGVQVSVAHGAVVVGSETIEVQSTAPVQYSPNEIATVGNHVISALSGGEIAIGTQTLRTGDPQVTIAETPVFLASSAIFIGSSSIILPNSPLAKQTPILFTTLGSQVLAALPSGGVIVGSITLHPGDAEITVAGTPIFLGSSAIAVGTRIVPLRLTDSVLSLTSASGTANRVSDGTKTALSETAISPSKAKSVVGSLTEGTTAIASRAIGSDALIAGASKSRQGTAGSTSKSTSTGSSTADPWVFTGARARMLEVGWTAVVGMCVSSAIGVIDFLLGKWTLSSGKTV